LFKFYNDFSYEIRSFGYQVDGLIGGLLSYSGEGTEIGYGQSVLLDEQRKIMDGSWFVDIRHLYPNVFMNFTKSEVKQEAFSTNYNIAGTQIAVSISSYDSQNTQIVVEPKEQKIHYDGKEIFEINLFDFFKFKGNTYFVDSTIADPYVPPVPSGNYIDTPNDIQYPMFQIKDIISKKITSGLGLIFHSFSKGTVGKTTVVIHSDSQITGQMSGY
jgi:hypothetical protein